MTKELAPHQQRVVAELEELDEKIEKLDAFATTNAFKSLEPDARARLTRQLQTMEKYSAILGERISAF